MIVCLGWGSLIWKPESLAISGLWEAAGPAVSVEFLRQSQNGRLTLVIDPSVPELPVLWAKMQMSDLGEAKESLRVREGNTKRQYIGAWTRGDESPEGIPNLRNWAEQIGAATVIWTALPAKFEGEDHRKPTVEEAIAYLQKLEPSRRTLAEEYIRRTPQQIATPYRRSFEQHFGWVPENAT